MYTASSSRRIVAYAIDSLAKMVLLLPIIVPVAVEFIASGQLEISLQRLLLAIAMIFAYHYLFLKFAGCTLGMWAMGLKVVPVHQMQKPLGWLQTFIRVLADRFILFFSYAPYMIALFRMDRRHFSDLAAETKVVQFEPRMKVPSKHWIMGAILLGYFFIQGVTSFKQLASRVETTIDSIRLNI